VERQGVHADGALTLALCIGANTRCFPVVHNVLLRPLPVPSPTRSSDGQAYPARAPSADHRDVPDYYDRLRDVTVFEEKALYNGAAITASTRTAPPPGCAGRR
jgi:hypothetical protein